MDWSDPTAGIPPGMFAARRARVYDAIGDGAMLLPAAPVTYRSRDTEHPYRPDSELFYLTGVTEPGAVAVLLGGSEPRFVLFVPERDPERERWGGPRLGPEEAAERFGADDTLAAADLDRRLSKLLREARLVHYRLGRHPGLDTAVHEALAWARGRGTRSGSGPRGVMEPGEILDEMRMVKEAHEIDRIRAAAALTLAGHRAGLRAGVPGAREWGVQAAIEETFRAGGATGPGFGTIVGSGPNACILHYVDNVRTICAQDLVLVDAGAEVGLYNGDVTRTFPASGRFTPAQREVHELVDAARAAAVRAVSPGTTVAEVHFAALEVLVGGLVSLGILEGSVEGLVEEGAHRAYVPHQTSHWLGLDVHDPGDYASGGASRTLEEGMVLTIEPGLYVPPGSDGAAAPFAGMGVRLEDDVVVTGSGRENLTADLPAGADGLEELIGALR